MDVGMVYFRINIDIDVEFVGGVHIVIPKGDEQEDIQVINNDECDSLDDGSNKDNKRRATIKDLGKEKTCSLGEVHKISLYFGIIFKSIKLIKEKLIYMHMKQEGIFILKITTLGLRHIIDDWSPVMNTR